MVWQKGETIVKKLFAQLLQDESGRYDLIEILRLLNQAGLAEWASEQLDQAIWEDPDLAREASQRLRAELAQMDAEGRLPVREPRAVPASSGADTAHLFAEATADLNRALVEDQPQPGSLELHYQRIFYLKLTQQHDPMGFLGLKELHSQAPLASPIVEDLRRWEAQRYGPPYAVRDGVRELLREYGA